MPTIALDRATRGENPRVDLACGLMVNKGAHVSITPPGFTVPAPVFSPGVEVIRYVPVFLKAGASIALTAPFTIRCRCGESTTFEVGEFPAETTPCAHCGGELITYEED